MKPYFQNSRVTLYCGNSLEVLAALEAEGRHFDLLLTDPPYGIDQEGNKPSGVNALRAKGAYSDKLFTDTRDYLIRVVRPIIDNALTLADLGIITGGVGSWDYLPRPSEEGCIFAPASPSFNSWGHQDYWPIYYYGRPRGNCGEHRRLSHQVTERGFDFRHPCSKPLGLWKRLMLCGTDGVENKTILDPFAGSGTTGRAAMDLSMNAVLIELNPRYCDIIAQNLAQEVLF